MNRVVFDTGALIALERSEREMWAVLKLAAVTGADIVVPSTVLAQAWRATKTQAQLARALQHCVIASFDSMARQVGELCGRTRTTDICDAHVALVAASRGDVLYTSDPADLRRLLVACGKAIKIVRC